MYIKYVCTRACVGTHKHTHVCVPCHLYYLHTTPKFNLIMKKLKNFSFSKDFINVKKTFLYLLGRTFVRCLAFGARKSTPGFSWFCVHQGGLVVTRLVGWAKEWPEFHPGLVQTMVLESICIWNPNKFRFAAEKVFSSILHIHFSSFTFHSQIHAISLKGHLSSPLIKTFLDGRLTTEPRLVFNKKFLLKIRNFYFFAFVKNDNLKFAFIF